MATYYWVGGSGTWDNSSKTNWSNVSGGSGGFGPPTSADTVNFDSGSGSSAVVSVASTAVAATTTINKSDINISLSGNATLSTSGNAVTLTSGTITLNTYILTTNFFISNNSNARTIAFGTGNITVTGNAYSQTWGCATLTGMTISGTPIVNLNYSGATGTRTINHGGTAGGTESNAVSFNITAGTDQISFFNSTTSCAKNVDFTGFAGTMVNTTQTIYGNYKISSGMTVTAGANPTKFAATSGTQQITTNGKTLDFPITFDGVGGTFQLQDNLTLGSTRAISFNNGTLDLNSKTLSCGFWSSSNSNTRSIAFGTGNVTLTGSGTVIWDMATTTGFTYTGTPTVNCTYNGSTGTRTIRHSNTAGGSESNSVSFYVSAGTDGFATGSGALYKTLNFTGYTGALTNSARYIYGDFVAGSGMTITAGTSALTFLSASSTQNVTTNNVTFDFPITVNTASGTVAFQDALTQGSTRAFTLTNGTLKFKAGVTSTVGAFATSGTNRKYLQSTLAGSQATLSQASGTVGISYTTIQDINATGGATWNAYYANGNIDGGNNTNWNFGGTPSYDAEYGYKLRSFTETGRF